MLPMMLDKFPPAPGISVEMFKQGGSAAWCGR